MAALTDKKNGGNRTIGNGRCTVVATTEIGIRLRERRTQLKIAQEELAYRLDISRNLIGYYERGIYKPSGATLEKIEAFLADGSEGIKRLRSHKRLTDAYDAATIQERCELGRLVKRIEERKAAADNGSQ